MVEILIIIAVLLILAGISKSVMDTVNFRFNESIFSNLKRQNWWNPKESWKNKYKDRDPSKGPAFPGSTTFLVWVTDAWHFFQMITYTALQLAIIIPIYKLYCEIYYTNPIVFYISLLITCKFIMGSIFELFWSKIWKKK